MKPTKIRNKKIYRAMNQTVSRQICAALSKDLRKKYPRRSARIMIDDTVKVIRGEYKGLTGKVAKISTESNSIAIEGNKKEKLKGEKVDVYIHSTNTIITSLNTDDKWRLKILEKKSKVYSNKQFMQRKEIEKVYIKKISEIDKIKIQVGGGIRSLEHIEKLINFGVDKIIIGTAAVENIEFLKIACNKYNKKIAISLDVREGYIALSGWKKQTKILATDFIKNIEDKLQVRVMLIGTGPLVDDIIDIRFD